MRGPVLRYRGHGLSQEEAATVRYLEDRAMEGYVLLVGNRLDFDLGVMAEESGMLCPWLP